jgi:4'-phosphopantetheinyl transferase EntD
MWTDPVWTRLLPQGVIVVSRPVGDERGALLPAERAEVERAVPRRRLEYAAGRACASEALARLGFPRSPLLSGTAREPLWPQGAVGSIAHSGGTCAAAVARACEFLSLGIDLEPDEPLDIKLWRLVATPRERERLSRREGEPREPPARAGPPEGPISAAGDGQGAGGSAKLLFSAKETFYKCQYPATRQLLDFQDVEVEVLARDGESEGVFRATLLRPAGALARGAGFRGRFARRNGLLFTAMAWPAGGGGEALIDPR